uniref:Endoplasmic reticulum membrane sensor NFE2L1 n=1 Tax=Electrophorus electricus TaxID=8005 RepID=A0A4W4E8I5_ELEEL
FIRTMQSLKKYFTEGLIQVAILLSLVGIRVDVNSYFPPLREIIHGQSSALTQTQFHNFHNSLDGHGLHPKSVDLDDFNPTHRLLRWVRSLDQLQVPSAELEAWLVHRDPENSSTIMPVQAGALDGVDVLEDPAGLTMRMGGGETVGLGYSPVASESLESVASVSRVDNEDIKEEDENLLWQQEPNHDVYQEQLSQSHHQHLSLFDEDSENELMVDRWRNPFPFDNQSGSILGEDIQVADADAEDPLYHHGSLFSPLLSEHEPLLDLEQQWQDVQAIMEPEVIPLLPLLLYEVPSAPMETTLTYSSIEEQSLSSLFDPLLEEAMFNQISLLDLGQEEGFGQLQDSQMEEHEETDSDSGLSLHFSQSPASPIGSESSCSSSTSSWSSTESAPEGAVGYASLKEELTDDEEEEDEEEGGAVGGFSPEQNKMCSTFLQAEHFHVGHDHTYNQPQYTSQCQATKQHADESLDHNVQDKLSTRDEKRARALKIPFSNDRIINLPVEEFNQLLAKHRLSEAQLTLIRDIRRRGKNKMAAQNCRRRKMNVLLDLECSVDGLHCHRARLLREKSEILRSVREMKQRLNDLYQEVYSRLREEQGILCSTIDPTLQQGNHSHVSISTHHGSESRRKSNKRRKDEE